MENLRKDFWTHLGSVGGPADLKDVFISWAANRKLNYDTADVLWGVIDREVHAAFGKKMANASPEVSGEDKDTVSVSVNTDSGETFTVSGHPGDVAQTVEQVLGRGEATDTKEEPEGPLSQVKDETLLDSFSEPPGEGNGEDEEEAPAEVPPLAGEGETPPAPAGAPPAGGATPPPPTGGIL